MRTMPRVLIVEDEPAIAELIAVNLRHNGFQPTWALDSETAQAELDAVLPDVILLDWMLPGMTGIELCRRIKRDESLNEIPIIMLTARGEEDNKIQGLDAGADDYITKPFSTRELVSRIKAVLRRSSALSGEKAIDAEGLKLDPVSHRVTADGKPVEMGPTEYRLLAFFMSHQERAYTRAQMLDQVWGGNVYVEDRTIDVHIRRLRKALEPFGFDRFIQTVRGTGYRFSVRPDTNRVEAP